MFKLNLQFHAEKTPTGKIERKYMAHMLDASFGGETENWVRLGSDLEEYNVELNPDVEVKHNILGEQSFNHNGYEISSEADPYYAVVGDPLFLKLQEIADNRYKDDHCKTKAMELHLWDGNPTAGYTAYVEDCYTIPNSYGGDTSGYQIPFTVYYAGNRVKGKYVPSTKTFTADAVE